MNQTDTEMISKPNADSGLSAAAGSVVLSGGPPMTRDDYERLKASGMMWEIYPEFTGDYDKDIISQNKGTTMEVPSTSCPQRETQITTQVNRLHTVIDENMLAQSKILDRIISCMREPGTDKEPGNECPSQQLCPLADTIRLAVDKLERLVSEKNDMLDRLEI